MLYDLGGKRVAGFNVNAGGAVVEENAHIGALPLAVFFQGLFYDHQDWLGTERLRTTASGAVAGSYASGPFGDLLTTTGADGDPYHFAMLDHDNESGLEHAQFRGYSSAQGHWMSPDPYSGSYDGGNPQSFNRYAYALNRPASETDPSGEDGCGDDDDGTGASEGINGGYGFNPNASDAPSGYTLSGVNTSDGNPIYSDPSGNQFVAQAGMPTVQISPNNNESVSVNSSNSGFSSLGLAFYTSIGYGQSGNSTGTFASGGAIATHSGQAPSKGCIMANGHIVCPSPTDNKLNPVHFDRSKLLHGAPQSEHYRDDSPNCSYHVLRDPISGTLTEPHFDVYNPFYFPMSHFLTDVIHAIGPGSYPGGDCR